MKTETLHPIIEDGQMVYVTNSGQQFKTLGAIPYDTDPKTISGCNNWKLWHISLVDKYGRAKANLIFEEAWENKSAFSYDYNFCKYDCDWSSYFKSQGIDIGHLLSNVICKTTDVSEDVLDTAGEISQGGITTAKVIKTAVPLALAGLLAFAGYYGYQVATGKKSLNIGPVKLGKK
jgi:hypothetical protein